MGFKGTKPRIMVAASSSSIILGKGLREPCPPYREVVVFGADLGTVNADNWNCPPQVVEPTTLFDLSTLEPYHEILVGLAVLYNFTGPLYIVWRWYRKRDNKLLFEFHYQIPPVDPYWLWYYVYSFTGWLPAEIWEDGDYYVTLTAGGQQIGRADFTVMGISEPLPTFQAGSQHTARITVRNPTGLDWTYSLYLMIDGVYVFDWATLPIGAGRSITVDGVVVMPSLPGIYSVALRAWEEATEQYLGDFALDNIEIVS